MGEASRDAVLRAVFDAGRACVHNTNRHTVTAEIVERYRREAVETAIAALSSAEPGDAIADHLAAARDEVKAALEASAQELGMSPSAEPGGWRPIETAPKDGTEVLGFDGRVLFSMRWVSRHRLPSTWHDRSANRWANPTHWMPLPSAPNPPSPENVG